MKDIKGSGPALFADGYRLAKNSTRMRTASEIATTFTKPRSSEENQTIDGCWLGENGIIAIAAQ